MFKSVSNVAMNTETQDNTAKYVKHTNLKLCTTTRLATENTSLFHMIYIFLLQNIKEWELFYYLRFHHSWWNIK